MCSGCLYRKIFSEDIKKRRKCLDMEQFEEEKCLWRKNSHAASEEGKISCLGEKFSAIDIYKLVFEGNQGICGGKICLRGELFCIAILRGKFPVEARQQAPKKEKFCLRARLNELKPASKRLNGRNFVLERA